MVGTDIVWWAISIPTPGVRGQTTCQAYLTGWRCDRSWVDLDFAYIDEGDNDWFDRRKTAMHEIGHTIGLGHHSPAAHDCTMVTGEVPSTDIKWRSYDAHDIGHINAAY